MPVMVSTRVKKLEGRNGMHKGRVLSVEAVADEVLALLGQGRQVPPFTRA